LFGQKIYANLADFILSAIPLSAIP